MSLETSLVCFELYFLWMKDICIFLQAVTCPIGMSVWVKYWNTKARSWYTRRFSTYRLQYIAYLKQDQDGGPRLIPNEVCSALHGLSVEINTFYKNLVM